MKALLAAVIFTALSGCAGHSGGYSSGTSSAYSGEHIEYPVPFDSQRY